MEELLRKLTGGGVSSYRKEDQAGVLNGEVIDS